VDKYERARELVLTWAALVTQAVEAVGGDENTARALRERRIAVERELRSIRAGWRLWGEQPHE